jgi:glucose/mannose-6-phosphate isomerase
MRNTLVIACSFSGNTFETINMAYLSIKRNAKLLALSHGGILQRKSKEWGVEHIKMPKTVAPRYVLPFNIFAITKIVSSVYSINAEKEIKDSLEWMQKVRINISTESDIKNNTAIKLAESILKKVAKIYGDRITCGVATRFKNSINENAKRPACFETMPEAFHNDVVSWENGSSIFIPVILRHKDEDKDEKKRIDKFTSLLKDITNPLEVRGKGKKLLSELVTMTYLLDYASYYLAILSGTDPLPTKMIDVMRR